MQASISPTQSSSADERVLPHVILFMKYVMTHYGRNFWQAVGEAELSMSQLKVLHNLLDAPGLSLKTLGTRLGLSMPAISRSVDGLVQRGLVTRAENTEDRRMKTLQVTDAGRELLERLMELRFAGVEEFVGTLTPEERTNLADALDPIVSREDVAASSNAPSLSPRKDSNA